MVTIGNEVNYNFLNLSSWDGYCAMAEISKTVKDAGIKTAFSFAAPEKASDIQYIIEQLGYACEKYEGAGYDYIGVNIYPNTHSDSYVKELKNTVEKRQQESR